MVTTGMDDICYPDRIEGYHLHGLFRGDIAAVRIKDYSPGALAEELTARLLSSRLYGQYAHAPEIARIGQSLAETNTSRELAEIYKDCSVTWIRELRDLCRPYLTPIDRLRLEIDEAWRDGARIGVLDNHKMFAGLVRRFDVGAQAEPHNDVLGWDASEKRTQHKIRQQLAANIYLHVPEAGGELTLWDVWPERDEYEAKRNPGSYGLDRSQLPKPVGTLAPTKGELILFNPGRVHAVEPITKGYRVTWSCFIGNDDNDNSLVVWS